MMQISRSLMSLIALPVLLMGCELPVRDDMPGGAEAPELMVALDPADQDDAEYIRRFEAFKNASLLGLGLPDYDVTVPVEGATKVRPWKRSSSDKQTISAEALRAVSDYATPRNTSALIVWRNGLIEHEEYFGGFTEQTPIKSASLAKPLSSLVIGRAIALGHIESLDQPVSDFVTEWQGQKWKDRILVRHLLDMRTGFLPQGFSLETEHILNVAYLHPRHDEFIVEQYPVIHKPGSRYDYANATSEMVAVVIERATGTTYGEFISAELLQKMDLNGGKIALNREGGVAHSGCCIFLDARAWLALGILVLQDGVWDGEPLLPRGYVEEMKTGTPQNPNYGLALYLGLPFDERRGYANPDIGLPGVLHSEPYLADDLVLFDGNGNQVVYIVPSLDLVILRTGQSPPKEVSEWDNSVLPNTVIRGLKPSP